MNLIANANEKSLLSRLFTEKTLLRDDQKLEKLTLRNDRCLIPHEFNYEMRKLARIDGILMTSELECTFIIK